MTIKIDDTELRRRVLAELDWEPTVDASTIGVAAKDGVVTLTGSVTIYAQKKNAERATKRVSELLVSRQWMQIAGSPAERGEGRTAPTIRLRPDRRGRSGVVARRFGSQPGLGDRRFAPLLEFGPLRLRLRPALIQVEPRHLRCDCRRHLAEILLVHDAFVIDDQRHHARSSPASWASDQRKPADHPTVGNVAVSAARSAAALAGEDPVEISVVGLVRGVLGLAVTFLFAFSASGPSGLSGPLRPMRRCRD